MSFGYKNFDVKIEGYYAKCIINTRIALQELMQVNRDTCILFYYELSTELIDDEKTTTYLVVFTTDTEIVTRPDGHTDFDRRLNSVYFIDIMSFVTDNQETVETAYLQDTCRVYKRVPTATDDNREGLLNSGVIRTIMHEHNRAMVVTACMGTDKDLIDSLCEEPRPIRTVGMHMRRIRQRSIDWAVMSAIMYSNILYKIEIDCSAFMIFTKDDHHKPVLGIDKRNLWPVALHTIESALERAAKNYWLPITTDEDLKEYLHKECDRLVESEIGTTCIADMKKRWSELSAVHKQMALSAKHCGKQ